MSVDHVEQLFRDSQNNMDEMPPKETWEKLHQKLEHHKTRKSMARIQKLAIAASILAIVSIGIVSVLFLRSQNNNSQFTSEKLYAKNMQPLNITPVSDSGIYTVQNVKTINQLLSKNANKIN